MYSKFGFIVMVGSFNHVKELKNRLINEYYCKDAEFDYLKRKDLIGSLMDEKHYYLNDVDTKNFDIVVDSLVIETNEKITNRGMYLFLLNTSEKYNMSILLYQEDSIAGKFVKANISGGNYDYKETYQGNFIRVIKNNNLGFFKDSYKVSFLGSQSAYSNTIPIIFCETNVDYVLKRSVVPVDISISVDVNDGSNKIITKKIMNSIFYKLSFNNEFMEKINMAKCRKHFKNDINFLLPLFKIESANDITERSGKMKSFIYDFKCLSNLLDANVNLVVKYGDKHTFNISIYPNKEEVITLKED